MRTLIEALTETIKLLIEILSEKTEDVYNRIKGTASKYIKYLLTTAFLWFGAIFLFALLKAYTGIALFGYMMAILAFFFALILGLVYAPLGIILGMLLGHTTDAAAVGRKYLKSLAITVFFTLMVSMYIIRVPMHQHPESIPQVFIAFAAVVIGSLIWGSLFPGRFYVAIAVIIMFIGTISFFIPQAYNEIAKKLTGLDSELVKIIRGEHTSNQNQTNTTIVSQAQQTRKPAPQMPQKYSLPRAEKTQPVAERNDAQARKQQIEKAAADSARKARADSLKLALEIEKSPQYIKAKLDSARAAQESLCVALERQYKYK